MLKKLKDAYKLKIIYIYKDSFYLLYYFII